MSDPSTTAPTRISVSLQDGDLAGWRWRNDGAPPLLFCHATGFCASTYKKMLRRLADRFDIWALDMRGHGRTRLPADPKDLRSWNIYARDVAGFLDREKRDGWILAGHSMGAVVVAMAARGRNDISALRLIEPVAPPLVYTLTAAYAPFWPMLARHIPIARRAARRRARWSSREDALKSYERKGLFRDWAPGVLADYLEDGLVIDHAGARLSCDPDWEAATFAASAHDLWRAVRVAPAPIGVFAAGVASTIWPTARWWFRRAGAEMTKIAEAGHLAPMENPALAADFIAQGAPAARN